MKYIVRELKEADLQEGRGFFKTMQNLSSLKELSFEERKAIWQKALNQDSYFFVAVAEEGEHKDQIIGTVKLMVEPKFFYGGKCAGHIEDVVTRIGFEGMGIASQLLKAALAKAEETACYKVILDCKTELMPFYEKNGFQDHSVCMRIDFKH